MIGYTRDIEEVNIEEFQNPSDAPNVKYEEYFRKNLCAMMLNAELSLMKRACIFAVYSTRSGTYEPIAIQYLLKANYPRQTDAKGNAYFDDKTYAEINFWINFYSILSQRQVDKIREYFNKERNNLPEPFVKMFLYIYGRIEADYL